MGKRGERASSGFRGTTQTIPRLKTQEDWNVQWTDGGSWTHEHLLGSSRRKLPVLPASAGAH